MKDEAPDSPIFSASRVDGATVTPDGARVDLMFANPKGERFTVRLPVDVAVEMWLALSTAGGAAQKAGYSLQRPLLAERALLHQDPNDPSKAQITVRAEGGLNILIECAADRIEVWRADGPDTTAE